MYKAKLIIDGEARSSVSGKTRDVRCPANQEVIGTQEDGVKEDMDLLVASADAAFRKWAGLTAYEREKIICKAADYGISQADEIGLLMAKEQGKPLKQSVSEAVASYEIIKYYAHQGVRDQGVVNKTEKKNLRSMVIHQPVGLVAAIIPWNYPLALMSWKLGPGLAAGCSFIIKPSSNTPLSSYAFCKALNEGGLPPGLVNFVSGGGARIGALFAEYDEIKKIAMTGSTATGQELMRVFGPKLIKVSLELGGNCPAIICDDADLNNAADMVVYKAFRNMGQSCSGMNRLYVQESVKEEFIRILVEKTKAQTIGDAFTEDTDLGPMTTRQQLEKVQAYIAQAVEKGASLVYGGRAPEGAKYAAGNFIVPAILDNCTHEMDAVTCETFGPIAPIITFKDLPDAVAMANDTPYGLVAFVFTQSLDRAYYLSEAIDAGTICVNNAAVNTPYAPYQGWKHSGYGFELSQKAMEEYLLQKHIKIQLGDNPCS
jgi:succinate-semialdehyde dehydrogenase/glutarate-semialdehyde dehydrogenase